MMVALKMPGTELICGPTDFTTTSREPITASMRTAALVAECGSTAAATECLHHGAATRHAEQLGEVVDGELLAGVAVDGTSARQALVGSSRVMRTTPCTDDVGMAWSTRRAHQNGLRHRQGERQADGEHRARCRARVDGERTAGLL